MEIHFGGIDNVLIAGAAGGIGSSVVRRLLDEQIGAIGLDHNEAGLRQLRARHPSAHGLMLHVVDLSDAHNLEATLSDLIPASVPIQGFVHCAAIQRDRHLLDIAHHEWQRLYAVNLHSCFARCQFVIRRLSPTDPASLVFVSSIHADLVRGIPHYSSAKAALSMLGREIACEFADRRVRVNMVAPGSIDTPLLRNALPTPAELARAGRRVPMGRLGTADEVANLVLFLLSDEASYVTGANVVIDGGLSLAG